MLYTFKGIGVRTTELLKEDGVTLGSYEYFLAILQVHVLDLVGLDPEKEVSSRGGVNQVGNFRTKSQSLGGSCRISKCLHQLVVGHLGSSVLLQILRDGFRAILVDVADMSGRDLQDEC